MRNWFSRFFKTPLSTRISLDIGEGNILIVTFEGKLSNLQKERIHNSYQNAIDSCEKVLVVDGNPKFYIMKKKL